MEEVHFIVLLAAPDWAYGLQKNLPELRKYYHTSIELSSPAC